MQTTPPNTSRPTLPNNPKKQKIEEDICFYGKTPSITSKGEFAAHVNVNDLNLIFYFFIITSEK